MDGAVDLGLTLDVGHLHCQGEVPIADFIRDWGDRLVNVLIRRNLPEDEQRRSRKWLQAVQTVDWLTSQFRPEDQYQIYMFNNMAEPARSRSSGFFRCT